MFKKNGIIEMCNKKMVYSKINNKNLFNKKCVLDNNKYKLNYDRCDIMNKNLYFIIQGEQVYIKNIKLPNIKKSKLKFIVEDELKYKFRSTGEIIYSYSICSESKYDIELLVFCLKWNNYNILNKYIKGNDIKGIWIEQFLLLNYCSLSIDKNTYILSVNYGENLYLLGCCNNKLVCNSVIKGNTNFENYTYYLNLFTDECESKYNNKFKNIYFANLKNKDVLVQVGKYYQCNDLGWCNREQIINYNLNKLIS